MTDRDLAKRQILDRIQIVDLIAEHVALKRRGRRWTGLCPFHADKTPSFTVSPEYASFKCFGCGKSGDAFSFVQYRENVTFPEAMRILADRVGVDLDVAYRRTTGGPGKADLARVNAWAAGYFRAQLRHEVLGRTAREYLQRRNVAVATAESFELGLAVDDLPGFRSAAARAGFDTPLLLAADLIRSGDYGSDYVTFRNRLMFPIRDATSRVIGFGGRTLVDDPAKYLNSAQGVLFDKGRNLYGIHVARAAIAKTGRAVLVEGYMDCLAAHQAGVTETVAALGTALTEEQVDILRRHCDQIMVLFDSDQAGEAAAERAIRVALTRCVTVKLVHIPKGKDPSEFLDIAGAAAFSDLLNTAVGALEFKWLQTCKRFQADRPDGQRREAIVDFLRIVSEAAESKTVDAIQRGLLVNQVAHLLRMERSDVASMLSRLRQRRSGNRASDELGAQEQPLPPPGPEQAAYLRMLEVLLNQPDIWTEAEVTFDLDRIMEPRDRRIAAVLEVLRSLGAAFQMADVLARLHDPDDVARVIELTERGAQRGNFAETFRQAAARIHEATIGRDAARQSLERMFSGQPMLESVPPQGHGREPDAAGVAPGRNGRFVPRRFIRDPLQGAVVKKEL